MKKIIAFVATLALLSTSCSDKLENVDIPIFDLDSTTLKTASKPLILNWKKRSVGDRFLENTHDLALSQRPTAVLSYMNVGTKGVFQNHLTFGLQSDSITSHTAKVSAEKLIFNVGVSLHTEDKTSFFKTRYITTLDTTEPVLSLELVQLTEQKVDFLSKSEEGNPHATTLDLSQETQVVWASKDFNLATEDFSFKFNKDTLRNALYFEINEPEKFINSFVQSLKVNDTTYKHKLTGLDQAVFALKATRGNSSVMIDINTLNLRLYYLSKANTTSSKTFNPNPLLKSIKTWPFDKLENSDKKNTLLGQGVNHIELTDFANAVKTLLDEKLPPSLTENTQLSSASLQISTSSNFAKAFLRPISLSLRDFKDETIYPEPLLDKNESSLGTFVKYDADKQLYTINLTATITNYINSNEKLPQKLRLFLPYTRNITTSFDTKPLEKFHQLSILNIDKVEFSIDYLQKVSSYKN